MGCKNTKRYPTEQADYHRTSSDGLNKLEPWKAYNFQNVLNETKIQAEYLQDFLRRLNNIKSLHIAYDTNISSSAKKLVENYINSYKALYNKEDSLVDDIMQYESQLNNIHDAINNLVTNIPYLKSAVNSASSNSYKDLSTRMNSNTINYDKYILADQYNMISDNIAFLEGVCAHNADNIDHNRKSVSSGGTSSGGGGGGGGSSNGFSPHYGGNSNCASHSQSGCSNHCGSYQNSNVCPQQGKSCGNSISSFDTYHYNS